VKRHEIRTKWIRDLYDSFEARIQLTVSDVRAHYDEDPEE